MRAVDLTVALLMVWAVTGTAQTGRLDEQVERWLWYPKEMVADGLSEAARPEIVAKLRQHLCSTEPLGHQSTARHLLVRLGDSQTIAEVIHDLKVCELNSRCYVAARGLCETANQILLIPGLADVAAVQEDARDLSFGDDLVGESRSVEAATLILIRLREAPSFSPALRSWAASLHPGPQLGLDGFRSVVRQWWQQNKEAFARQDYAAVKPLQPVSGPGAALPPRSTPHSPTNAPSVVSATVGAPAPRPSPVPGGEGSVPDGAQAARPAPEPDGARPGDAPPTARSPWPMVGAGVVLLGLTVLGILALRRRHRD